MVVLHARRGDLHIALIINLKSLAYIVYLGLIQIGIVIELGVAPCSGNGYGSFHAPGKGSFGLNRSASNPGIIPGAVKEPSI